jgi:hypothetical protein
VWLSPARKVNAAKEIAYQQRRFLDFGKMLIDTQPWVTFLTCVKHRHVEDSYKLSAARFPELADKRFWDELTVDVQATRLAAEERLDPETVNEVKELCDHQNVADKLAIAPETMRRLRDLRAAIESKKTWIKRVAALFAGTILAGVGAAVLDIKELRNSVAAGSDLRDLQDILGFVAVMLGLTGFMTAIYAMVRTTRAADYLAVFKMNITPILQLAHVDPATCTDNLDYVEQVINSVAERYRQLQEKFLRSFISVEAGVNVS